MSRSRAGRLVREPQTDIGGGTMVMVPVQRGAGAGRTQGRHGPPVPFRAVQPAAIVTASQAAGRFLWEVLCAIEPSCERSRVVITRAAAEGGASRGTGRAPWPSSMARPRGRDDTMKLGSRDSRPGRSAWRFLVALSATVALLVGACGSPGASAPTGTAFAAAPATAVVLPDTPAGTQLRWLMAAT